VVEVPGITQKTLAGAADRYRCSFDPGPHKFDLAMQAEAFAWFERWLKG
jgi:hypothetical protein